MTDTQSKKISAKGEGYVRQLPTGRWQASITRKGVYYSKNGSREDVQAWSQTSLLFLKYQYG